MSPRMIVREEGGIGGRPSETISGRGFLIERIGTGAKPVAYRLGAPATSTLHDCAPDRTLPNVDHVRTTPGVHDVPLQVRTHNRA